MIKSKKAQEYIDKWYKRTQQTDVDLIFCEERFSKDKIELVDKMCSIFVDEARPYLPYIDLLQIIEKTIRRIAIELNNGE